MQFIWLVSLFFSQIPKTTRVVDERRRRAGVLRDKELLKNHTPVFLPLEVNRVCALLPLGDSVLSIPFHFSTLVPCGRAALVHRHIQALTRHKFTEEGEENEREGSGRVQSNWAICLSKNKMWVKKTKQNWEFLAVSGIRGLILSYFQSPWQLISWSPEPPTPKTACSVTRWFFKIHSHSENRRKRWAGYKKRQRPR